MKILGWILKILIVALGIGLFMLQSQLAKNSILEFILNQPLKDSPLHIEVDGVRGLFPFQFEVASVDVKDGEQTVASLANISGVWSMPSLMALEMKVNVIKGRELAGEVIYYIGKHALLVNLQGEGVPLGKSAITSVLVELPALNLLRGTVKLTFQDGSKPITLTLLLEELDEERLKIKDVLLDGLGVKGQGQAILFPRQGAWEGEASLSIEALSSYQHWFQKKLDGSALIHCQKKKKSPLNLEMTLKEFFYGSLAVKSLKGQVTIDGERESKLTFQGQEALINTIPFSTVSATASLDNTRHKNKGVFDFIGKGPQKTSFHTQGTLDLPSDTVPYTRITFQRADLSHPQHQFSLKQPTTFTLKEQEFQTPKIWLAAGSGTVTIQDLIIADQHLSGEFLIDQLPLTLLRIINPDWIASGFLSGKGNLKGTMNKPEADLSIDGKSLQWGLPRKTRYGIPNRSFGIDLTSTFKLGGGFLAWQVKLASGRLFTLASQGKVGMEDWSPTPMSSIDWNVLAKGDMDILSLAIGNGDLIKGQASLDLTATGTIKEPLIKGHISIVNGLYENAAFGTLIRNIKISGSASNNLITVPSISGQDNAKGRINGHAKIKLTSFLNPDVDLQLNLEKVIVVQNDEITGKATGTLKLQGPLFGEASERAKITGDIMLKPLDIQLEEHAEKMVTIKLLEKGKNGSYHVMKEQQSQKDLQKSSSLFPLNIKITSPKKIYLRGYGFDSQWKGDMRVLGTLTDPYIVGEISLVQGKLDLLGKPLKLTDGLITYSEMPTNDPLLAIVGIREVGEVTASMRIEGRASDPKITFSSSPSLPQEEVLARLLFGRGVESMSVTQSLLLANALSTFKGKNNLNFSDKIRSAFGLDVFEFTERKSPDDDEFKPAGQQVSVGKQITDKVYLSLEQSVSGEGGTSAKVQFDVTSSLKIEADVGGDRNTGVGFAWVKKY
jgi:hypothetical protein